MKIAQEMPRSTKAGRPIASAALLLLALAGCGSNQGVNSPETFDRGSLDEVGGIYRNAVARNKKPPAALRDLAGGKDMFLLGYDSVAKGDVVVYWGVTPVPEDQPADEVLAYKAAVPAEGGAVLLKNTTVRRMTAAEFAAAPKPSGPTSK